MYYIVHSSDNPLRDTLLRDTLLRDTLLRDTLLRDTLLRVMKEKGRTGEIGVLKYAKPMFNYLDY